MAENNVYYSLSNINHQSGINRFMDYTIGMWDSVDPVTVVSYLFRHGYISNDLYNSVQLKFLSGRSRHDIMIHTIEKLSKEINSSTLVRALDETGYKDLAARLYFLVRSNFSGESSFQQVSRSSGGNRTRIQTLYRNLKRMVHDSQFINPRQALRLISKRSKAEFENERDPLKRQKLADRCVALLGVELDAYYGSIGCQVEITQEEMLVDMKQLIPETTNALITDTIVYSREANLDASHRKFGHAEHMLIVARNSAYGVQQCLELVNLLYVEVYVKLWEFEMTPSRDNLDALMMWGRIGLESLTYEDEDTRCMWKRMFILRMVFALLGIGNNGNIIHGYVVEKSHLREAQDLLADIDKVWNGIEVRREMFYCIARARLNEQLGLLKEAMTFLQRAKSCAIQGQFFEVFPSIVNFSTVVEEKMCAFEQINQDSNFRIPSSLETNQITLHYESSVNVEEESENELQLLKCPDFPTQYNVETQTTYAGQVYSLHDNHNMNSLLGEMSFPVHEEPRSSRNLTQKTENTNTKDVFYNSIEAHIDFDDTTPKELVTDTETCPKVLFDIEEHDSNEYPKTKLVYQPILTSNPIKPYSDTEVNSDGHDVEDTLQDNSTRLQLKRICQERTDFGSIALYEDREEPEGTSHNETQQVNVQRDSIPVLSTNNRVDEFTGSMEELEFSDNALFG